MDEATRISLKDQFNSLLVRAIEGRRGGMALMRVLEELDFYNSPASAKHHLKSPAVWCCILSMWQELPWNYATRCRSLQNAIRTQS